jgi:TPR repeat protein
VLSLAVGPAQAGALDDALAAYKRGDYARAIEIWQPLAAQGDADAEFWLGALYDQGRGVPQSHETAARMYLKAAEQGQANAQFNLGQMYEAAEGVDRDYRWVTAAAWYRRAAEQGYRSAQGNLGALYVTGRGVQRDLVEAYKWLALAGATKNLEFVARQMTPDQIDEAKGRVREWLPKKER